MTEIRIGLRADGHGDGTPIGQEWTQEDTMRYAMTGMTPVDRSGPEGARATVGASRSPIARYRWAVVLCLVAASAVPARAQGVGPSGPSGGATLVQQVLSAPPPGTSNLSAVVGVSWMSGQSNTAGINASGFFAHSTKRQELLRLDGSVGYAKFKLAAKGPSFTVANNNRATFTFFKQVAPRLNFITVGGYRRDVILALDHRVWGEAGHGSMVIMNKYINVLLGASAAVGHEARGTAPGTRVQDVGVLQMMTLRPTPLMTVDQSFEGRRYVGARDDKAWIFRTSATAMVARHVGLQVAYKYAYDELHPFGVSDYQAELMAGMQITWATPPPKPAAAPAK
jgi:hypothetical protein